MSCEGGPWPPAPSCPLQMTHPPGLQTQLVTFRPVCSPSLLAELQASGTYGLLDWMPPPAPGAHHLLQLPLSPAWGGHLIFLHPLPAISKFAPRPMQGWACPPSPAAPTAPPSLSSSVSNPQPFSTPDVECTSWQVYLPLSCLTAFRGSLLSWGQTQPQSRPVPRCPLLLSIPAAKGRSCGLGDGPCPPPSPASHSFFAHHFPHLFPSPETHQDLKRACSCSPFVARTSGTESSGWH